jgi:hypothetical protein
MIRFYLPDGFVRPTADCPGIGAAATPCTEASDVENFPVPPGSTVLAFSND